MRLLTRPLKPATWFHVSTVLILILFLFLAVSPFQTALADTPDEKSPQIIESVNLDSDWGIEWENPKAVANDDGKFASVRGSFDMSQYLLATGFGFELPGSAKIQGIEVKFSRYSLFVKPPIIEPPIEPPIIKPPIMMSDPATLMQEVSPEALIIKTGVFDETVQLFHGELKGENKASGTKWPSTEEIQSYGGAQDLWGEEWNAEQINSEKFGVALRVNMVGDQIAYVDSITIHVYYQLPTITSIQCNDSVIYGDSLVCVATVTSEDPRFIPMGSVNLSSDLSGKFSSASCDLEVGENFAQCQVTYTPVQKGTHTVIASYSGEKPYLPSQGEQSIEVKARTLYINGYKAESKIYDGTTNAVISGEGVLENIIQGDAVSLNGTPEGTFADKNVGKDKVVTVSGLSLIGEASNNYELAPLQLSANIEQRTLTITADHKTKKATQPDPEFSYTVTGLVNGEELIENPTCEVSGEHRLPGTYEIECSGASAGDNYNIKYEKGTLVVSPSDNPLAVILTNTLIKENLPSGSTVGRLIVVDPDSSTHSLSFCGGADDASFQITGNLLKTAAMFNYEAKNQHEICIRADDELGGILDQAFTIEVEDVPDVELLVPETNATLKYNRPLFDWEDFPGAIGYQIQISNFSRPIVNTQVKDSEFTPRVNLPANTILYWRVRARLDKTTYSNWSEVRSLKTAAFPPSSVALYRPTNNVLYPHNSPITFSWRPATAPKGSLFPIEHYELQIASDATFRGIIWEKRIEHEPAKRLYTETLPADILSPNLRYYWRVLAYNTAGEYSISLARSFRIAIVAPTPISPSAQINSLTPTFEWSSVEGASGYTLQISTDEAFKRLLGSYTFKTATTTYTPTKALPAGRTFYWRVRANGVNGPSAWSPSTSFSTP